MSDQTTRARLSVRLVATSDIDKFLGLAETLSGWLIRIKIIDILRYLFVAQAVSPFPFLLPFALPKFSLGFFPCAEGASWLYSPLFPTCAGRLRSVVHRDARSPRVRVLSVCRYPEIWTGGKRVCIHRQLTRRVEQWTLNVEVIQTRDFDTPKTARTFLTSKNCTGMWNKLRDEW